MYICRKSLAQHIINNFGLDFFNKIWNKELNGDINPFTLACGSNKKYWWNCPKGEHKPFLRSCLSSSKYEFRCGKCKSEYVSFGENRISNILKEYNINYDSQYKFDDCKCIRPLPFDFYLPDYNILIEYDGRQHYKPSNFGGIDNDRALDNFISTKIHDTVKTIYCKENNIKLIRIPYWDFNNIEEILIKELDLNKQYTKFD